MFMKPTLKILVIYMVAVCLASCQSAADRQMLDYRKQLMVAVSNNNISTAMDLIDSIHVLFPREIELRRFADTALWRIEYGILSDSLPKLEREIMWSDSVVDVLSKKFKFIKNEKYETIGHFEHKLLNTERGVNRCYLKPMIDEHGVGKVASHYVGPKSEHTGFSVTINDNKISTGELSSGDISTFEDADIFHELMVASSEKSIELLRYIASYPDERVKVTLEGNTYVYYLTNLEKEAFSDSWLLQNALSTMYRANDTELRLQQKVEILKKRLFIE